MKKPLATLSALGTTPAMAQDLDIEVTNLTHGIYFTPLLVAAHDGANHLFMEGSETLQVQGIANQPRLTLATMLVNTNDAFVGLDGVDLSGLGRNESMVLHARVYDAGTEANSETAATIPGPAGGGEGYNAARDERDFIAVHRGVVSRDDGLATSALDASHRFDNPGARIVITRTR